MTARRHSATVAFTQALGPLASALAEDTITDLHRNADGGIHIRHYGAQPQRSEIHLSDAEAHSIIRLAADLVDTVVTDARPLLKATLPDGSRFQGVLPPVASAPTFSIRRHRVLDKRLPDYVDEGILTPAQCDRIRTAIAARRNIVISGDMGVGKTTLLNAMLAEPSVTASRLFVAEDTREIRPTGHDVVQLRTSDTVSLRELVVTALRMRADRIAIGEARSGGALIEILKAWTTGHRGGFSTIHAEADHGFVVRMRSMLQEVISSGIDPLIGYGVDLVVHLIATPDGPRCSSIASVGWDGSLRIEPLDQQAHR